MDLLNVLQIVDEEIRLARERIVARIGGSGSVGNRMRLEFRNKVPRSILTGDVIGEGDARIQVVLIDNTTGDVIDVGPYASASVEIVVLNGVFDAPGGDHDWTVKEFNDNIVGKPLLRGNVHLKLHGGIAVLENIKFRNYASKMNPPLFRLAARVVDTFEGIRIMEAMTESFTVKIYREKYSMKHEIPARLDDVYRLRNICKGGKIHKLLQRNGICTVEDFLIRNLINPEELKSVTVTLGAKKLEATINHALECPIAKGMYCYINNQQKITAIAFNLSGQTLGIYRRSQGGLINTLAKTTEADIQELLASAYQHWVDTVYFDDEDSLCRHLTSVLLQNCPSYVLHNIGTSNAGECESSNTGMESTFTAEATGDDLETLFGNTVNGMVTNVGTSYTTCKSMFTTDDLEAMFSEPLLNQEIIYFPSLDYNGPCYENPFLNEEFAATEGVFSNQIPMAPKRWKRLFCVSRLSYRVRKKMQKV